MHTQLSQLVYSHADRPALLLIEDTVDCAEYGCITHADARAYACASRHHLKVNSRVSILIA
jgi:uncharacterized protein YuzB (UPF0349 family)